MAQDGQSSIAIRQLQPDEWKVCQDFVHEAVRENSSFFGLDAVESLMITEGQWRSDCSSTTALSEGHWCITFCACVEGHDVGMLSLGCYNFSSQTAYGRLGSLFVKPAYRGRGVARALVEAARARAQEWRLAYLEVSIHEKNKFCLRLFGQFGAVEHGIVRYTDLTTHRFLVKRIMLGSQGAGDAVVDSKASNDAVAR